jgi:hypothetical protein
MTDVAVTGPNPVILSPADQIDALASALAALGFSVAVNKVKGFTLHPCCVVSCGRTRHLRNVEMVFAADDDDGDWWYFRVNPIDPIMSEKITPLSQPSAAADLLARTMPQISDGGNANG